MPDFEVSTATPLVSALVGDRIPITRGGVPKTLKIEAFSNFVVSVVAQGAVGDGVTNDAPAFVAALAILYANKGGVLEIPHGTYALASSIVIDPGQYTAGRGIIVRMYGSTFIPSHTGWCFDFKTNYFGAANGGNLGKKLLVVQGDGAVIAGASGAAGGLRASDTIGFKCHDVTATGYATGWGIQLNVSTTDASTWCEQSDVYNCRASGCLYSFGTYSLSPNSSFLGTKMHHCIAEGRVNNCVLFWFQGGPWSSTFVACGGFYNQNSTTGGRGILLDGNFAGTTFISAWIDTGVDSSGNNPSTQSALTDIAFGSNYTTDEAWLPTFIGSTEINLPPGWRTKLLVPGPFPYAGTAGGHMSANPREVLRSPRIYYVAASGGSDSNDGLTTGTAFATIANALTVIFQTLDLASVGITIQLANGTYTEAVSVAGTPHGLGTGSIIISAATAGSAIIAPSSGNALTLTKGAQVVIAGLKLQATAGAGASLDNKSVLTINAGTQFGACSTRHIIAVGNSDVILAGDCQLTGNAPTFVDVANRSGFTHNSGTLDTTGRAFTSNFTNVHDNSTYTKNGGAYATTSCTGTRYFVYNSSSIQTFGGGASLLPGNAAGFADASTFGLYV